MTAERRTERLARAAFAVLVAATFAAFFVTQKLKHEPPVIQNVRGIERLLTPQGSLHRVERLSFHIKSADDVTVTVINARGITVATLDPGDPLAGYKRLDLRWYGRTSTGVFAPAGVYRFKIVLRKAARQVIPERDFTLELG